MKAIVLSAGIGQRLGFKEIPKPMVEINGKPVLEHNILLLKKYGVTDICINLHYLPDVIKNYFQDGSKWGVQISYSLESKLLGTGGAVKNIERFWNDKPFFVIYGDNFTDINLADMYNFHTSENSFATIALFDPQISLNSGIAGSVVTMDKHNKISSFIEGQKSDTSGYVNAGVYVLEPGILDIIPEGQSSDFGKDIFPSLIKTGHVLKGYVTKGFVIAIDDKDALQQAEFVTKKLQN